MDDLLSDKFLKELKIKKKDVSNISKVLKTGDELLVQVVREPMGEKNISVTTNISLTGKFIAFIPNNNVVNLSKKIKDPDERKRLEEIGKSIILNGNGMIIRTFAKGSHKEAIEKEYKMLSNIYMKIEKEYKYSYAPKLLHKSNSLIDRLFLDYIDSVSYTHLSHTGLHILYHLMNSMENVWCERVFAPWTDMEEVMRKNNIPLYGLESKDDLTAFDFVGFTLQYEMSYTNVLNMLDLGNIPVSYTHLDVYKRQYLNHCPVISDFVFSILLLSAS